jgi:hypothetical protein
MGQYPGARLRRRAPWLANAMLVRWCAYCGPVRPGCMWAPSPSASSPSGSVRSRSQLPGGIVVQASPAAYGEAGRASHGGFWLLGAAATASGHSSGPSSPHSRNTGSRNSSAVAARSGGRAPRRGVEDPRAAVGAASCAARNRTGVPVSDTSAATARRGPTFIARPSHRCTSALRTTASSSTCAKVPAGLNTSVSGVRTPAGSASSPTFRLCAAALASHSGLPATAIRSALSGGMLLSRVGSQPAGGTP